jgi:hypothetical protein
MIVAAASGIRLTAAAILSAVRSCSSRPMSGEKPRRGSTTVTWVPGTSASRRTSSWAAWSSRRSGVSIISNGMSWPNRTHRSCSWLALAVSMTKWTARSEVGRRLRAYRSAASVARSMLSTSTSTTRRV